MARKKPTESDPTLHKSQAEIAAAALERGRRAWKLPKDTRFLTYLARVPAKALPFGAPSRPYPPLGHWPSVRLLSAWWGRERPGATHSAGSGV